MCKAGNRHVVRDDCKGPRKNVRAEDAHAPYDRKALLLVDVVVDLGGFEGTTDELNDSLATSDALNQSGSDRRITRVTVNLKFLCPVRVIEDGLARQDLFDMVDRLLHFWCQPLPFVTAVNERREWLGYLGKVFAKFSVVRSQAYPRSNVGS